MNEATVLVPARTDDSVRRRAWHSRIRVHRGSKSGAEAGPDHRHSRYWPRGRLHFAQVGFAELMIKLWVRLPHTCTVCFVWSQLIVLSLMAEGGG